MTTGMETESSFSGIPEGLSRKRTTVAGPEYVPSRVTVAVNVTRSVVIHSPCAWAIPCPMKLLSLSTILMGNEASKYHGPGADPETTKIFPTVELAFGEVTTTLAESGCVDVAAGGVDVAVGASTRAGIAKRTHARTTMTIKRRLIIPQRRIAFHRILLFLLIRRGKLGAHGLYITNDVIELFDAAIVQKFFYHIGTGEPVRLSPLRHQIADGYLLPFAGPQRFLHSPYAKCRDKRRIEISRTDNNEVSLTYRLVGFLVDARLRFQKYILDA